jgi:hypothetical protein
VQAREQRVPPTARAASPIRRLVAGGRRRDRRPRLRQVAVDRGDVVEALAQTRTIASAIVTERCWPPVQPIATVSRALPDAP